MRRIIFPDEYITRLTSILSAKKEQFYCRYTEPQIFEYFEFFQLCIVIVDIVIGQIINQNFCFFIIYM